MGMVSQRDLLAAARELAGTPATQPPPGGQHYLLRPVLLYAENCADMLVGEPGSGWSRPAWRQAYRALQHGTVKQISGQNMIYKFPIEIQDFAKQFAAMQGRREAADYDPTGNFAQSDVIEDIDLSADVIAQFRQAPERDRRAFAVYVLLNLRSG